MVPAPREDVINRLVCIVVTHDKSNYIYLYILLFYVHMINVIGSATQSLCPRSLRKLGHFLSLLRMFCFPLK